MPHRKRKGVIPPVIRISNQRLWDPRSPPPKRNEPMLLAELDQMAMRPPVKGSSSIRCAKYDDSIVDLIFRKSWVYKKYPTRSENSKITPPRLFLPRTLKHGE